MAKECVVQVRLTGFDKARLEALAASEHRTLSKWIENRITVEYDRLWQREPDKYPEHPKPKLEDM